MILVSKFLVLKNDLGVCQNADSGHQTQRFLFRYWGCSTNWTILFGKGPKESHCKTAEMLVIQVGEEGLHLAKQKHHAIQRCGPWCPRTGGARIQEPCGSWPSSLDFLLWNKKEEQPYGKRHIDILREEGGKASGHSERKTWSHRQSLRKWNNCSRFKERRKALEGIDSLRKLW